MRIIGLTGGIGTGKSTVAGMLRELGANVIDADQIAREIVASGTPALSEIAQRFPGVVMHGVLDRAALAARVFGPQNAEARAALEAITHPRIAEAAAAKIALLAAQGVTIAIYEAALIVEKNLDAGMRGLIVVTAPPAVQLARITARDTATAAVAQNRIASQLPEEEKRKRATWIVDNAGDLAATRVQVERIWKEISNG